MVMILFIEPLSDRSLHILNNTVAILDPITLLTRDESFTTLVKHFSRQQITVLGKRVMLYFAVFHEMNNGICCTKVDSNERSVGAHRDKKLNENKSCPLSPSMKGNPICNPKQFSTRKEGLDCEKKRWRRGVSIPLPLAC